MSKILATCVALAITAAFAIPAPAGAAERTAPAVKQSTELTDVSAARRHHRRYVRHYHGPRYYSRGYYAPYRAYGYDPYYRPYRPYYRPGISVGVGPFGFGMF